MAVISAKDDAKADAGLCMNSGELLSMIDPITVVEGRLDSMKEKMLL
jgi:hypothetical protein